MYSKEIDSYNPRMSNTSIASEIYEEIDNICSSKQRTSISNEYEEADKIPICNFQIKPPALPRRQGQKSCVEDDRYDRKFLFYFKFFWILLKRK